MIMDQSIQISQRNFDRLVALRNGFESADETIGRVIDSFEYCLKHHAGPKNEDSGKSLDAITIDVDNPGDLRFTRIMEGKFGNDAVSNWNKLVYLAHKHALRYYKNFETLKMETLSNIRKGSYTKDGYKYYADIDISIQGDDTKDAWRKSLALARKIKVPIEIHLEWRNKPDAAHPGEKGILSWHP
jgi:hypothetical protein